MGKGVGGMEGSKYKCTGNRVGSDIKKGEDPKMGWSTAY